LLLLRRIETIASNFRSEDESMKLIAVLMMLTGVAIGLGGAQEIYYYGAETKQFWAGVCAAPAGILFAGVGILLWCRGLRARQSVLAAGLIMASATIAATALGVMGLAATLVGLVSPLVAVGWTRRIAA
jgi:hypothetical protein